MKTSRASAVVEFGSVISVFLALYSPLAMVAVPGDEHWDAQFGWSGPGGYNYAITTQGGRIYASGAASTTNVALEVWDGNQWTAMSQFYGPSPVYVLDLAFAGNDLYAAGYFTNVDGVTANGFARWDGSNWMAPTFTGTGYHLAIDSNNVYVGGNFINPDGVTATNIGYWDGNSWQALGDGLGNNNFNDVVWTMIVTNGLVYAGGSFTNSGTLAVPNLAVWNGFGWSAVGGGVSGTVQALAWNGNDLYVGGNFSQAGVTPANNIAVWDGSTWTALGTGLNGTVSGIVLFSNLVEVTGTFTSAGGIPATNFAIWNGTSWAAAGAGLSSSGARVIATGTNVYAGGNFFTAGGIIANGLASWDGMKWNVIGTPGRCNGVSSTVFGLASDGTNLYAGGLFTYAGKTNPAYIARFDGNNWYSLGSGIGPVGGTTGVRAVAVSSNNVYVGGSFSSAGGMSALNVARWDGNGWSSVGGGISGTISALVTRSNDLFVAGNFNFMAVDNYAFAIARWDGTNWWSVRGGPSSTFVFPINGVGIDSIVVQNTNLYLGGNFSAYDVTMGNSRATNIMRWNGANLYALGGGVNTTVVTMAIMGTNLFVGGSFTNAGGVAVSQIARWDGNSWWNVGGGVIGNGTIVTLTALGNNLYAGGSFTNMGGVAVNHIAKWDGTNWSALGSGTTFIGSIGPVDAFLTSGSDLYVGGGFHTAGGKPSQFIGRWNDRLNFNAPQLMNPTWLTNRQFQARLFGISGMTNVVQASSNLTSWTPILTNNAGIYDFTDPSASGYPRRFYRAVLNQ